MVTVIYDGTFEGFLTAVFEVYEYKFSSVNITTKERFQQNVFNNHHESLFNEEKAARVWKGLTAKISAAALSQLYKAFLSEETGMEDILLKYIQYAFAKKQTIESDYSNAAVLTVIQTAKKVYREKHRMEAFIRFQLTGDGLFYAVCQPDFNVLPLIEKHFKSRYADQRWLIYDSKRKYGIYYDRFKVETVQLSFDEKTNNGKNIQIMLDEKELLYQQLWQQYFKSVNIVARKNTKLHIQHMPKRYWKFLPEKQSDAFR
ncbi:TIGR03915 family putative DNA repair protein [Segetibacter koreensis]|uniref:TIGR03915 family putative DNA repair protein n=1 Tax=Segetibacter koreensis TaxID=398037 RepID=UPI000367F652|nr:TIGR03915 family putative DNA repair protein [Segetibacter koreensis]